MVSKFKKLTKLLPETKENVLLKNFTTFGIGGPAKLFYTAKTISQLTKAVKLCRRLKVDFFILGRVSNVLVADSGFLGMVIKNEISQIKLLKNNRVIVASGMPNQVLVNFCQKAGLSGTEFLVGIPGTIGGAVRHNARFRDPRSFLEYFDDFHKVKDNFISDIVEKVKLLLPNGKIVWRAKRYCEFVYGASGFGSGFEKKNDIILEVVLKLKKADPKEICKAVKIVIEWRQKRGRAGRIRCLDLFTKSISPQPQGKSAGCIFSNTPNKWNHPAGRMIDMAGLKGKRIGGAKISELHANFIINDKGANAQDVIKLIKLARSAVKKKFGVQLKEEISFLGFKKFST